MNSITSNSMLSTNNNTFVMNLKTNLNLPINSRQSVAQRESNVAYEQKMQMLQEIRASIPALNVPKEQEFDTTDINGDQNRYRSDGYTLGTF
jgi:hypothetical protein